MPRKLTTAEFIEKARKVHGDTYDYGRTKYMGRNNNITYQCRIHGEVSQRAGSHLTGAGCRKCANEAQKISKVKPIEEFIELAEKKHGERYDYSCVEYTSGQHDVTYWCPTHERKVTQRASSHLDGVGCPECGKEKRLSSITLTEEEFRAKVKEIHQGLITIPEGESYTGWDKKIKAVCSIHGEYETLAGGLIRKGKWPGCLRCSAAKNPLCQEKPFEEFESQAKSVHGDKYRYHRERYFGMAQYTTITCIKHGRDFDQMASAHVRGQECPSCAAGAGSSKAEEEIAAWLEESGYRVERNLRGLADNRMEADIWLPEHNLAIEHNGLFLHSEWKLSDRQYHKKKTTAFAEKGLRVIHIWQEEWRDCSGLVKSFLLQQMGEGGRKYHARKLTVAELAYSEARNFLEYNHLQGSVPGSLYLGLHDDSHFVAVAVFSVTKAGELELRRYATERGASVRGGLSKLITAWKRKNPEATLVSFCDLAKFTGRAYRAAGFTEVSRLPPDYWYTNGQIRKSKESFRRAKMERLWDDFDPEKPEKENAAAHGWYRIWDCGKIKFVL